MKDKLGIIAGIGIAAAVIVTLYFFVINTGNLELNEILSIVIVLILVISAMYVLFDRIRNIRKGLPAKDERLTNISYKAGYYGFISAIWSAVIGPVLSGIFFDYELEGHHVAAVVVLCGGLTFIISYLYLAWKGK